MNVSALIEARGGLASRGSLLVDGASSAGLSRAVAAGEVVRVAPSIYRCGSVNAVDRLRAAVVATGGVASHDAAAALWDLDLLREPELSVTVPRNRSRTTFPGVTVHRGHAHGTQRQGVLTTSVLQTVLDCARVLPLREAVAVADSALRKELITDAELSSVKPTGRGAARIRRVLLLADSQAGSFLESLLRVLLSENGIAPPYSQYVVRDEFGALARADFA